MSNTSQGTINQLAYINGRQNPQYFNIDTFYGKQKREKFPDISSDFITYTEFLVNNSRTPDGVKIPQNYLLPDDERRGVLKNKFTNPLLYNFPNPYEIKESKDVFVEKPKERLQTFADYNAGINDYLHKRALKEIPKQIHKMKQNKINEEINKININKFRKKLKNIKPNLKVSENVGKIIGGGGTHQHYKEGGMNIDARDLRRLAINERKRNKKEDKTRTFIDGL